MYATTTRSKYVHVLRDSQGRSQGAGIRLRYACGAEAFVFPHGGVRQFTSTGFRGHMALKFRELPAGATQCPKCAALNAHGG
jgi:hypothetical protein